MAVARGRRNGWAIACLLLDIKPTTLECRIKKLGWSKSGEDGWLTL
jgi:hypothetical protein